MHNRSPTSITDPAAGFGPIPSDLVEQLKESVPRRALVSKIESAIVSSSASSKRESTVCLVTGEPGSGKTFLAAQLTKTWNCAAYFIRVGNVDGFIWKDARKFLISLGLQLRARYGAELFGPPVMKIEGELKVGVLKQGGKAAGVEIEKISLSPFQQVLIDVNVSVDELTGEALLIRIGEVADTTENMSLARLAQEALSDPLRNLAAIRPDEQVMIVVDSLDDSLEITKSIPFGQELEGNVVWVLTSQPGDHLDRFVDQGNSVATVRLDLSDPEIHESSIEEAASYALARLSDPSLSALLESAPMANRPVKDLARDMAEMSNGNFLYLYHLLNGIQAEAEKGRFDLMGSSASALPRGLDGIYRYFVTNRIRTEEHKRNWREQYTPVLGVLAVARAPLVSTQIAAFSKLGQLVVDEVLGEVHQFLETTRVPGDLAYYIYHRSFADFLLTQDKSRNPFPLRSDSFYHAGIADSYESLDESAWSASDDRYALIHLPAHLVHARRLERLCQLLRGAFGQRQMATVGPAQTRAASVRAAQAAMLENKDELFLQLVEFSNRIASETEVEWESGCYVLALLNQDPKILLERTGMGSNSLGIVIGGPMVPWSGFLVAERLLDLGASLEAREVLRMVERRAWLNYRAPNVRATNMLEGSAYDFVLQDDLIAFLARVAQADAGMALALTKRLFVDSPQLPNVRTAWREVMRAFLAWRADFGSNIGSEVSPVQCQKFAETTVEWLRTGGYVLGWAGITRELFKVLARALPAPAQEPMWLVNAILVAVEMRLSASGTTQGATGTDENNEPDETPGTWAAIADVMTGILGLLDALRSFEDDQTPHLAMDQSDDESELLTTLTEISRQCAAMLPPVNTPTVGGYTHRTAALGHLSWTLYEAKSERWKEFSEAALAACYVDASIDDPPLHAVMRGLLWLRRIGDRRLASRVQDLIAKHDLGDRLEREEREAKETNVPVHNEQTLAALEQESDSYGRGRIVLSLWRRNAATLTEIQSSLQKALTSIHKKRAQHQDETPPIFSDVLAEALVEALTPSTAEWLEQVTIELNLSRTPARQQHLQYDAAALNEVRLHNLTQSGETARLRAATEAEYQKALAAKDLTEELGACLLAISFDPDLADRWFSTLRKKLKKTVDLGLGITRMVAQLKERQPERLDDLGARWVDALPTINRKSRIEYYQILICELWGKLDIFRPQLIALLYHFTATVPDEVEAVWSDAMRFEEEYERGDRTRDENSPDENDAWDMLGEFIIAVGQITVRADDDSNQAARNFVSSIRKLWDKVTSDAPIWKINFIGSRILSRMEEENERWSIQPGPIAEFIVDFYETAITEETTEEDATDDEADQLGYSRHQREKITLGASLAISLKQAKLEWAETRFQEAFAMWDAVLVREPARAAGFEGIAVTLVDTLTSALDKEFRNSRERSLFELTRTLTEWCLTGPFSSESLIRIQARLSQVPDRDLRSLLLGVVARGWLESGNWERASKLAQVVGTDALVKAGFYGKLRSLARDRAFVDDSSKQHALRPLVLDAMLSVPLEDASDAFVETLTALLRLRTSENIALAGTASAGDDYLKRIADWTLTTAKAQRL